MLSRVAESVYWMNRNIERAENVARFIDVNYNLTLGEGSGLYEQWSPLVNTTGDDELFKKLHGEPTRENVLFFLAFDTRNPNSIISCVSAARENARTVRETITSAMWEQINKFYLLVKSASKQNLPIAEPIQFCYAVRLASHTLDGLTNTTMSQGEAWHFSQIARLLERADKTSRIVDVQYFLLLPKLEDVGTSLDVVRWAALLRSASALEMYRRKSGKITPQRVADFLILDRSFPRSIHHCLIRAQESLGEITGNRVGTFNCKSEQLMGRLRSELDYTRIDDVIKRGMHEYIDEFQVRLNEIGTSIHRDFFIVTTESREAVSFAFQAQA